MRALVTGASSGIGAAFARTLAARGASLVLVARDRGRLEATAATLGAADVEILTADLANRDDVARVVARIEATDRPVHMVVNNAGFGLRARLADADPTAHDEAFEVMVRAVRELSGAAARAMRSRGSGVILNVSSTAGLTTMGAYAALKAWVTVFTESLANELRGTGVTVTALLPGWVRTEFHDRAGIRASRIPDAMWLDADDLVAAAMRDVRRGKVVSIPSLRYRAAAGLLRHLPRPAVRWLSHAISASRAE